MHFEGTWVYMNSIATYFEDTYRFQDISTIVQTGVDDKGYYFVLDKTLFYPQGGGQPADQGFFILDHLKIPIHFVRMLENEIRHYTEMKYSDMIEKQVELHIDSTRRILHAKLHTAGHLIRNVVESLYPTLKVTKGHHFPNECYVEFHMENNGNSEINLEFLNKELENIIQNDLKIESQFITPEEFAVISTDLTYSVPHSTTIIRVIKIEGFYFVPCGGTHVKSLSELTGLQVTKQKVKGNTIKMSYSISSTS